MSKPFSETDLSQQLTEDRTWRIKEISDLRSAIERADSGLQRVLLRALVTICYAHWEGYVRFATLKYLQHISLRKLSFKELDRQFLRNYFLPRLAAVTSSRMSVAARCTLIDEVLNAGDKRFSRVNEDLVNTRSNLNFEVFADICLICGVPIDSYQGDQTFIDVFLLKRRNGIAHGEDTFVQYNDLGVLVDKTISLIRAFGDSLENRIVLGEFRINAS